jgi:adenylate kinase family enzyme
MADVNSAPPARIHIVGGPGSGKTTLAGRLAARTGSPAIDLDRIGYGEPGAKRSLIERRAAITEIATEPAWITEGIYLWWTDELLHRADVIVWLDLPWRVAARRIVTRHLLASLRGSNRHAGIRLLVLFLRSARRYYSGPAREPAAPVDDGAVTRAATEAVLARFRSKLIHCRSAAEVTKRTLSLVRQGEEIA